MDFTLISNGRAWFARRALFLKLIGIGALGLLLLIPLGLVNSTLRERDARYRQSVREVTETWGRAQRLLGPVLVVPYSWSVEYEEPVVIDGRRVMEKKLRRYSAEAFFLPEQLEVQGELEPSERRRGIYVTQVYTAKLKIAGKFSAPDLAVANVPAPVADWSRARLCVSISDPRGTRGALTLLWNDRPVVLEPGARLEGITAGVHAPLALEAGASGVGEQRFALTVTLNGSQALTMVPLGRSTQVRLKSSWAGPSFTGAALPVQREVGKGGFDALWESSVYGRTYPQQWTTRAGEPQPAWSEFEDAAFGVQLVPSVDAYRTVERAIKYGVLFITLVFTAFFLFEAVAGVRLNALNYLLVGAALCLFYLGLLALSEFMRFGVAYGSAATASVALIGLYAGSLLRSRRRAVLVTAMLGGVYGYLFFVLQMEDFALVAGTGALFAMLGALMFATRRFQADPGGDAGDSATRVGPAMGGAPSVS